MNPKQKIVIITSLLIILLSFLIWIIYGGEIFTKTKILVETKDELFGWTEKKWVDKFIWGLDLSLIISLITIITGGVLYFLLRTKSIKKINH